MSTRTGLALGYDPSMDIRDMARWMQRAEAGGFVMGFFSETIQLVRDAVSALAAFGLATEKILLGATQIVRLRHPVIMAQTIASLDELTGGRMVLAPGAFTRNHARFYRLRQLDPVVSLTEWVEAIRRLLTGEPVTLDGQVVKLQKVQLSWRPPRARIPMWIAATSRTGLELAARIGDGVLLNAVASPEYTANAVRILRNAVEEAGRDWDRFEVAKIVNCSVEDTHAAALEAVRWEVASKFKPGRLTYNAKIRMNVGEPYLNPEDIPRFEAIGRSGGFDALMRAVPAAYIEGLTASGTPEEVVARVQTYRDAGVTLPLLRPAAGHQIGPLLELFASG
jgi:5,10-methylenetetrahydromethanopterin reductase